MQKQFFGGGSGVNGHRELHLLVFARWLCEKQLLLGGGGRGGRVCLFSGFLNVCKSVFFFHVSLATPPRRMEECLIE